MEFQIDHRASGVCPLGPHSNRHRLGGLKIEVIIAEQNLYLGAILRQAKRLTHYAWRKSGTKG